MKEIDKCYSPFLVLGSASVLRLDSGVWAFLGVQLPNVCPRQARPSVTQKPISEILEFLVSNYP